MKTELTHHQLMSRGQAGIQQVWDLAAPIIVAILVVGTAFVLIRSIRR